MQSTIQKAIALEGQDISNVCQKNGKTLARLKWLRLWPKNPKIAELKDLKRLKAQIVDLGVYKPLVVTPDGEVLGGNQRFKVLNELVKEGNSQYEWVWVSIVEAWSDEDRLKYALSDNEQIGKYTHKGLTEVLKPFMEQPSLLKDYNIEITDRKGMDKFIDELTLTENELQSKQLRSQLKTAGVDEEIINDVVMMSKYNNADKKEGDNLENIMGSGVNKYDDLKIYTLKLAFTEEHKEQYERLVEIYNSEKKNLLFKTQYLLSKLEIKE